MPRFSCSLDDDQNDWLEAEADRRDRSKADVLRQCIDAVRTGSVQTDEQHTDQVNTGENHTGELEGLRDRVGALEARLEDLEDQALVQSANERPADRDSAAEPQGLSAEEDDVVEWVRTNQPASRSDIVDAFEDYWTDRGIKGDSWWRRHARPTLEDAGFEFVRNVGWQEE